ncbi:XRE family transcriptional regulator [Actinobacillus porcinus]|uniref:XRE family transcriptional regulator n=1 Tax=Actinobacillus porcinus TaxID=51048 RepID=UPI002357BA35|nr:helix-turn-helix transcriptional regulator [Actinobacillus porcinus]
MDTLADRIQSSMLSRGLTQQKLAELVGITQQSVNKIVMGETLNPKKIVEIANALDVDVQWLKTGKANTTEFNAPRIVQADTPKPDDVVRVEIMEVEVSAGNGAFLSRTEQGLLAQEFDLAYFRQQFGRADSKNLKILTVRGDSMEPTLESGDLLYVDVAENFFTVDGIYVFTYDNDTFVKRLQKIGKKILVISDNKEHYREWEFDRDEGVYIHGRVVFSLPMKWKKC